MSALTTNHLALHTVPEAAAIAGVEPATIRSWQTRGLLPRHVHGGRVLVAEADLLEVEHQLRAAGRGRPRNALSRIA